MLPTKEALLAAGDIRGLLALNKSLYGDAEAMARGIAAVGDVLTLADGTDLNQVWNEFQAAVDLANSNRAALIDLLTFRTGRTHDYVMQNPSGTAEFEDASEYGVPQGSRAETNLLQLGYDFRWKDLGTRYTWMFLAEATAPQVQSLHNGALAADSRLQYKTVLSALFNNTNRTSDKTPATIYSLWNGTDGQTPPPAPNGNTFSNTHTHYLTTGTATLSDPRDVEEMVDQVLEHGYGEDDGATIVVLCNRREGDLIAGFRAGINSAKFDFISSDTSIPYLTTEQLVGSRPPGQFSGMKVTGQYGPAYIAPTPLIPAGYMAAVAVGGPTPVIGLREHERAEYRGLRIVRGNNPDYPITDAYYIHGIGAGVRQRGASAIRQVTASGTYTAPTF